MGYNSILAIRFSDLDRIAETPEFASVLARCAQRGCMDPTGSVASSDLPGVSTDWNIRVSCVTHSSGLCAAVLGGPELIGSRLHAMEPADKRRDEWITAARLLAGLGYEAKLGKTVIAPTAENVPAAYDLEARLSREAERLAAHRANPSQSVVAFTVLHDGFYGSGKDAGLGARMRDTVLRYDEMHDAYMDGVRRGIVYSLGETDFRMGHISNGMTLIGLVPEGWQELVLMGGNHGRLLDGVMPIGAFQNDIRRQVYEKIRAGDINEVIRGLNSAGISVKAPGARRYPPLRRAGSASNPDVAAAQDEDGPAGP